MERSAEAGNPTSRQLAEKCGVSQRLAADFIDNLGEVSNLLTSPLGDEEDTAETSGTRALLKDGKDQFGVTIPSKLLPSEWRAAPEQ